MKRTLDGKTNLPEMTVKVPLDGKTGQHTVKGAVDGKTDLYGMAV